MKASGATWRYSYTVWDELASAMQHSSSDLTAPITQKVSYTFDALGRRISERRYDGGGALTGGTNFHYDGDHVAHEVAVDATGAIIAGSAKWTTHSDGVDDLLSVTLQAGTGPSSPTAITSGAAMPSANGYYYHTDHQGSVRAITDQTGTITNAYAYDSYGKPEESVESLAQRFRYTGREWDAATNLYHYRARAYDPETGRFLQEDPLWFDAGDLNVYRITWNNPVNWTDPSAMAAATDNAAITGITVGVIIAAFAYDHQNNGALYQSTQSLTAIAGNAAGYVGGWLLAGVSAAVEWSKLHMQGLAGDLQGYAFNGDPYGIVPMYNTPAGSNSAGVGGADTGTESAASTNSDGNDPCAGLRKQLGAHRQKLSQYQADPHSMDNLDILNGPFAEQIFQGRLRSLERQIRMFENEVRKCETKNGL